MPSSIPPALDVRGGLVARASPPTGRGDGDEPDVGRFGTIVGAAAVASWISALPPALRVARASDTPAPSAWLAAAALEVIPMVVALVIVRRARFGLRAFGGEGAATRAAGAAIWLALTFVALGGLGALLRATTHHKPLAGATFGVGAVVLAVALAVVAARLVTIARDTGLERPFRIVGTGGILVAAVAAELLSARASATVPLAIVTEVADGTIFVVAAVAAAWFVSGRAKSPESLRRRMLGGIGPPVAVGLVLLGVTQLRASPALRAAIDDHAPALAPLADLAVTD